MATTGSLGILAVYILVAIAGAVYFWRIRREPGQSWNVLLDVLLPLAAVAVCGYTIYASVLSRGRPRRSATRSGSRSAAWRPGC